MPITILDAQQSVFTQILAELRNQKLQRDRQRFRWNLFRAGFILAYEASRQMPYLETPVTTPLGQADSRVLAEPPVLISILRAGNALLEGVLEVFDFADVGYLAAYRTELTTREIHVQVDYIAVPPLTDRIVFLIDPMLATGNSIMTAYEVLRIKGRPQKLFILAVIASEYGLSYVQKHLPEAHIYVGAVDKELTARGYIVPGLGDAGDLAYGSTRPHDF